MCVWCSIYCVTAVIFTRHCFSCILIMINANCWWLIFPHFLFFFPRKFYWLWPTFGLISSCPFLLWSSKPRQLGKGKGEQSKCLEYIKQQITCIEIQVKKCVKVEINIFRKTFWSKCYRYKPIWIWDASIPN